MNYLPVTPNLIDRPGSASDAFILHTSQTSFVELLDKIFISKEVIPWEILLQKRI